MARTGTPDGDNAPSRETAVHPPAPFGGSIESRLTRQTHDEPAQATKKGDETDISR